MSDPIEYPDLDDLIDPARMLLGDPPPIRDIGLLGSAAAQPQPASGATTSRIRSHRPPKI